MKKLTLALLLIGYATIWYLPFKGNTTKEVDKASHQIASIK